MNEEFKVKISADITDVDRKITDVKNNLSKVQFTNSWGEQIRDVGKSLGISLSGGFSQGSRALEGILSSLHSMSILNNTAFAALGAGAHKALSNVEINLNTQKAESQIDTILGMLDKGVESGAITNDLQTDEFYDAVGAVEHYKDAMEAAKKAQQDFGKYGKDAMAQVKEAMADIATTDTTKFNDEQKKYFEDAFNNLSKLQVKYQELGKTGVDASKTASTGLKSIISAAYKAKYAIGALTLVIRSLVKTTNEVAKLGDEIDKTAQKLNMSAGSFQLWKNVVREAGMDASSFEGLVRRLNTSQANALDGAAESAEAFERLGISLKEVSTMNGEQLFAKVIKSLQKTTSNTKKAQIANELFGRSYAEIAPLLNMSAKETENLMDTYQQLGGIMSGQLVQASAQYENALNRMRSASQGFRNAIAVGLLPAFTEIINGITQVISWINVGIVKLQQFFGIAGAGVDNRGIKHAQNAMDAYTTSTNAAVGASNKLKRSLQGFDELNVLQDNEKGGGGGSVNDILDSMLASVQPQRDLGFTFVNPTTGEQTQTYYQRGQDETYVPFGESEYDTTGTYGWNDKNPYYNRKALSGGISKRPPQYGTYNPNAAGIITEMGNEYQEFMEPFGNWLSDITAKQYTGKKGGLGGPKSRDILGPDAGYERTVKAIDKAIKGATKSTKEYNVQSTKVSNTVKTLNGNLGSATNAVKQLGTTTNEAGTASKTLQANMGTAESAVKSMGNASKTAVDSLKNIGGSIKDANTNLKEFPNITTKVKQSTDGLDTYWKDTVETKYSVSYWEGNYGNINTGAQKALPALKKTVEDEFNAQGKWIEENVDTKLTSGIWETKYNGIRTGAGKALDNAKTDVKTKMAAINTTMDNETKDSLSETKWIGRFDNVKSGAKKSLQGADTEIADSVKALNRTLEGVAISWSVDTSFKVVMGKCIQYAEQAINSIRQGFNKLGFTVPASVKAGETFRPNIPAIYLTQLARGGIVDGATPFIAGEAGKEAIIPLEQNTGWIDKIAEHMASSLGVSNGPQTLVLQVGETELGRVAINGINNITRSTGSLPLVIG